MKTQSNSSNPKSSRSGVYSIITCLAAFIISLPTPLSAEEANVVITGDYAQEIACCETHHELTSYVVEPGEDKFSGVRHLLDIPVAMKKDLRPGVKIRITGKKQERVTKKMSKGQVRKDMARFIVNGVGLPYETKDMASIIKRIIKEDGGGKGVEDEKNHDHGEVRLMPVDDDHEMIEVGILEHIAVSRIEVIK